MLLQSRRPRLWFIIPAYEESTCIRRWPTRRCDDFRQAERKGGWASCQGACELVHSDDMRRMSGQRRICQKNLDGGRAEWTRRERATGSLPTKLEWKGVKGTACATTQKQVCRRPQGLCAKVDFKGRDTTRTIRRDVAQNQDEARFYRFHQVSPSFLLVCGSGCTFMVNTDYTQSSLLRSSWTVRSGGEIPRHVHYVPT